MTWTLDAVRQRVAWVLLGLGFLHVPLLALTGVEGKMFHPMAITVMLALGGALVLALTLMPPAPGVPAACWLHCPCPLRWPPPSTVSARTCRTS